ncbi:MAG TPA: betaine/proline/choline family ABC transporter ATP-binding protein [Mycobacteriales bacterium]|nr:betaine/proline/choline family ABC transporter ATP-binding protein [Mycobacteriales bacterium]
MISLDQVSKTYADGTVAVHELSLDVAAGEIAVLVGLSGCGKTTTMRMINRLVEPSSGRITVDGLDVASTDPVQLRRRIGYVIQQVGLFPHQTVAANIATVPKLLGWDRTRTRNRVGELLELVGLDVATHGARYPHQLSGGQRQRVGVARALAADPPVLLMDEPFGAVDPVARDRLQVEFLRLQEQVRKTVVFVTHDVDEAIRLGDRIAVMREGGHLEQYAAPQDVLADPATPFVAEFVGAERTLRRLSVVSIAPGRLVTWPTVRPDSTLAECAAIMDAADAQWAVVTDGAPTGWLSRADAAGEGLARDRAEAAAAVRVGDQLEKALAAILAGNAPGAIVTEDGRYAGVLLATDLVTAARARG